MSSNYKMSLVIDANTAKAISKIRGLEVAMNKVSKGGGFKGFMAGGASKGLFALRKGVGGLGKSLSMVTSLAGGFLSVGKAAFSAVMMPVKLLATGISKILGGAIKGVGFAIKGLAVGIAAAVGTAYAALKAISPAAWMEEANITMKTLLKSTDKAKQRMAWIKGFEGTAPFDIKQLVQAANMMESFGIYSKRTLKASAMAAKNFGKELTEIVGPLAKLKQGMWEGESLGLFGITRDALKTEGIQFNKQGSLVSSGQEAFDAVVRYMEKRFAAGYAEMGNSFNTKLSTIKSRWFGFWANAGKGALKYGKGALDEIIATFDIINEKVLNIDWSGPGQKLVDGFRKARGIVEDIFNPARRDEMKEAGGAAGKALINGLADVGKAIARDIGETIGNVLGNIKPIGTWLMDGLQGVFRFGISLFAEVWQGMGKEFQDKFQLSADYFVKSFADAASVLTTGLVWVIDKIPGTGDLSGKFDNFKTGIFEKLGLVSGKTVQYEKAQKDASAMTEKHFFLSGKRFSDKEYDDLYKKNLRKLMGWGTNVTSSNLQSSLKENNSLANWASNGLKLSKATVSTKNTAEALKGLGKDIINPYKNYQWRKSLSGRRNIGEHVKGELERSGYTGDLLQRAYNARMRQMTSVSKYLPAAIRNNGQYGYGGGMEQLYNRALKLKLAAEQSTGAQGPTHKNPAAEKADEQLKEQREMKAHMDMMNQNLIKLKDLFETTKNYLGQLVGDFV